MKKIVYFLFFISANYLFLSNTNRRDPNNPPTESTGAPGEKTCISSGCHTQGTPTGTVAITGIPDVITPNTAYVLTIKNTSTNGKATGFEMTCLDEANKKCGTFTANANVSAPVTNSREYARNAKKTQLTAGAASWTVTWTSPAILTNPKMTFYFAGIFGNGDGKEKSDGQFVGTKTVTLGATAAKDAILDANVSIFPNPTTAFLNINIKNQTNEAVAFLYDVQGREIKKMYLDAVNTINVSDIKKGTYQLQIWIGNRFTTKNVIIQ
jgi:Secretion system C-terminal sorting domain